MRLPVTFAEATLGADVKVPTLDAPVTVRIPPGTPSGKVLRVRGQGRRRPTATAEGRAICSSPSTCRFRSNLTGAQRDAIEALAAVLDDDPRAALFASTQDRTEHVMETHDGR